MSCREQRQASRLSPFREHREANMQSQLFRAKAEKCLRLAELSETEPVRLNLVAIARCWYQIALETRRAEQQYAAAVDVLSPLKASGHPGSKPAVVKACLTA